jgi:hypothetical protein
MLHHDKAIGSCVAPHLQLSGKKKTSFVPHPPYSLDLAPADFFLFPKLKTTLKGCRFQTVEEIQKIAKRELRAITESSKHNEHSRTSRKYWMDFSRSHSELQHLVSWNLLDVNIANSNEPFLKKPNVFTG